MNTPIIVSGLGRCGTTLMVRMLEAGGLRRGGDYYEEVETIPIDRVVVKLLDTRILEAKNGDVIWMQQDFDKQAKSQRWLLEAIGLNTAMTDEQLASWLFMRTGEILSEVSGLVRVLRVHLEHVLLCPRKVSSRIANFLGEPLNLDAMAALAIPSKREMGLPPHVIENVKEKVRKAMSQ